MKELYGEEGAKAGLKAYANEVMDQYAKNFKRDRVTGNKDLVYYGKLEKHRYYTYNDPEVKNGPARKGEAKPGEQMHMQILVSRKDATDSIKLSPLNNSKGSNIRHSKLVGQFDRVAFKQSTEKVFDQMFGYDREVRETFKYANTLKHGTFEQRQQVKFENYKDKEMRNENQSWGLHDSLPSGNRLLDGMLLKVYDEGIPVELKRNKKVQKGRSQNPEYSSNLKL